MCHTGKLSLEGPQRTVRALSSMAVPDIPSLGPYLTSPLCKASSAIILRAVKASSLTRLQKDYGCHLGREQQSLLVPSLASLRHPPLVTDDFGQALQGSHIGRQAHVNFLEEKSHQGLLSAQSHTLMSIQSESRRGLLPPAQ